MTGSKSRKRRPSIPTGAIPPAAHGTKNQTQKQHRWLSPERRTSLYTVVIGPLIVALVVAWATGTLRFHWPWNHPVAGDAPPIKALLDPTGSAPCGAPVTVVPAPGPVGKSIYGDYSGQSPSGGWLNVLVQGNDGDPVTIESVTATVLSRQPQPSGAVIYSGCQGSSPSKTYIRLDLRAVSPTAVNVPAPDPTDAGNVIPLPIDVTGSSPAQFYIDPVSGSQTIRWRLQIHWERGSTSGVLTVPVSGSQSLGAGGTTGTVITTVGTVGDEVLCPGPLNTYAVSKTSTC